MTVSWLRRHSSPALNITVGMAAVLPVRESVGTGQEQTLVGVEEVGWRGCGMMGVRSEERLPTGVRLSGGWAPSSEDWRDSTRLDWKDWSELMLSLAMNSVMLAEMGSRQGGATLPAL